MCSDEVMNDGSLLVLDKTVRHVLTCGAPLVLPHNAHTTASMEERK